MMNQDNQDNAWQAALLMIAPACSLQLRYRVVRGKAAKGRVIPESGNRLQTNGRRYCAEISKEETGRNFTITANRGLQHVANELRLKNPKSARKNNAFLTLFRCQQPCGGPLEEVRRQSMSRNSDPISSCRRPTHYAEGDNGRKILGVHSSSNPQFDLQQGSLHQYFKGRTDSTKIRHQRLIEFKALKTVMMIQSIS